MQGAWLTRMRWRRRGAWLWPVFAVVTLLDAVLGHLLPPSGETQTLLAGALAATVLNLIGVVALSAPVGRVVRRARSELPVLVARDYAGTYVVLAVAVGLLVAGIAHHPTIVEHRRALEEAIVRAQAFIGYRAPREFRGNVAQTSTVAIEAGSIYRTCVASVDRRRTYCVVVKPRLPLERSVSFAGYESNSSFASGS